MVIRRPDVCCDDCSFWGLNLVQSAEYHGRVVRMFARMLVWRAVQLQRRTRLVFLAGLFAVGGGVVNLVTGVISIVG